MGRFLKFLLFFIFAFIVVLMINIEPIIATLKLNSFTFKIAGKTFLLFSILKGIIVAVIILSFAIYFSKFIGAQIKKQKSIKANTRQIILKASNTFIFSIVCIIALNVMGIDLTALTVLGGVTGIGIGLGLQRSASNFISGLILLFEQSIKIDDLIELVGGTFGFVRYIGARYTLIETFDGKEIMIPNENFLINEVINWTYSYNKGRLEIKIKVSADIDMEKAREIILKTANDHPICITTPDSSLCMPPLCLLADLENGEMTFSLLFWIEDISHGFAIPRNEMRTAIWQNLIANGIYPPLPKREIKIKEPHVNFKEKCAKIIK